MYIPRKKKEYLGRLKITQRQSARAPSNSDTITVTLVDKNHDVLS